MAVSSEQYRYMVSVGVDKFMAAMRRLESGSYQGKYTAAGSVIGSGSYAGQQAYGAYQIMPGNWAAWSSEAGLPGADIRDPAAQDAVARYKFTQYYLKYGDWDLVAIAWFAGGSTADRAQKWGMAGVGGLSDGNTTVKQYVSKINQYMDAYQPPVTPEGYSGVGQGASTTVTRTNTQPQPQPEPQPKPPVYQVTDPNSELGGFLTGPTPNPGGETRRSTMQSSMIGVLQALSNGVKAGSSIDLSAGPTDRIELEPADGESI